MATRKGKKEEVRPTLEEVAAQTGKYLFVTYEGTEGGGWGLPAPRPRFATDVREELNIVPFEAKQIEEYWLENPYFIQLYEKVKGIKVWKSDALPPKLDLILPDELASRVSRHRQSTALIIAMSPFETEKDGSNKIEDVIAVRSMDVPEDEAVKFDHTDVLPFLKVLQFYEKRLLNRPEVMRAIEKRLAQIINEKPMAERVESY